MSKRLQITLAASAAEIYPKALAAARSQGIDMHGDHHAGRFAGRGVAGTYAIAGDQLHIEILKKPLIAPWALIESTIKNFFTPPAA